MDNLLFALGSTMPVFLTMAFGVLLRRLGILDEKTAGKVNGYVFKIALPFNLFTQLCAVDFFSVWDMRFVLFCFGATLLCIGLAFLISRLVEPELRGEFVQGAYRSSASLLGMAFIQNMYGTSAMGGLMMLGSVPLYNVAAVLLLEATSPEREHGQDLRASAWTAVKQIVLNPIILGILAGCLWSVLRLPRPRILMKTLGNVAATATPMGLMAMGAALDMKKIRGRMGPALLASALKLIAFAAIFTPLAVLLGFRREKLIACLVMLGSATTFASYVMAKNMGHEGVLSQAVVMLTTLLSAFTLTGFIWALRAMGML